MNLFLLRPSGASVTGGEGCSAIFSGIRARLVFTYLLIITLTVAALEVVVSLAVKEYYMGNIEALLRTHAENAANFYRGYLSNTAIEDNTREFIENFDTMKVQIQVTDTNGKVLADSIRSTFGKVLDTSDIRQALSGTMGSYTGKDPSTGERVMSVAVPLENTDGIAGAARFTTSLELTVKVIGNLIFYFILAGSVIVLLIFFVSLYLSHTITAPVKKITRLSREIAKGNFGIRARKERNDEIGMLSESINHMADEIQKTDRLKNEFISSISHELKTPLTSIKGWAVTLGDTGPEDIDIIKRGIYIINSEADRLTDMLEELLDFSRLQSGRFSLRLEPVDIMRLLADVSEQMKPRALRQKITLELDVPEQYVELRADDRRIRQILINLLDNSLKFTKPEGLISIRAGIQDVTDGSGRKREFYRILVEDNGCGIDPEELPMIRNRFFRGRNADSETGIGLGLSICDELVKAHGGSMDIASEPEKGTSVTLLLPMDH